MELAEGLSLYELSLQELAALADGKRRATVGDGIELCTIINAKSGCCARGLQVVRAVGSQQDRRGGIRPCHARRDDEGRGARRRRSAAGTSA